MSDPIYGESRMISQSRSPDFIKSMTYLYEPDTWHHTAFICPRSRDSAPNVLDMNRN